MNDELYVREDYYGQVGLLKEAEKQLGELVSLMKRNPLSDYTNHPINVKFCKTIANQFGLRSCHVIWHRTAAALTNVYTLFSTDLLFDGDGVNGDGFVTVDKKKGYYDRKHKHILVIDASATAVSQLNLSAQEYMAILLHEIGHNFDYSPYMAIQVSLGVFKMLLDAIMDTEAMILNPANTMTVYQNNMNRLIAVIKMTNPGKAVYASIAKIIDKLLSLIPAIKYVQYAISTIVSALAKGFEIITLPVSLAAVPTYVLLSPAFHLLTVPTRKSEHFADSFATAYGYGQYLATALIKLEKVNMMNVRNSYPSNRDQLPSANIITDLAMANRYIITVFMGSDHGSNDTRIYGQIKMLKAEISSGKYPPEVKSLMIKEVNEIENVYNKYMNIGDDNVKLTATCAIRKLIYDIFGGDSTFIAKLFPDATVGVNESSFDKTDNVYELVINQTSEFRQVDETYQQIMDCYSRGKIDAVTALEKVNECYGNIYAMCESNKIDLLHQISEL